MSTVQFFALLFCAFCLAALLLGLVRPTWVLPLRRATRWQVLLLYSAACLLVLLIAGELPYRSAHAQIADPLPEPLAGSPAGAGQATARLDGSAAGRDAALALSEQEPEPESLRALASRMLLDLGFGAGHRLRIGRLTLVYEDPVTAEQAMALGDFLSRSELGASLGAGGASSGHDHSAVQIHLSLGKSSRNPSAVEPSAASPGAAAGAVYELRIATSFSHRQQLDAETKAAYQLVGLIVSGLAFDGAPVTVHICTSLLRPLLILRPQLG